MDTLVMQGIRCFRSRQEVSLAPLTLLVGENSTGKSTFLAALRLAWDVLYAESEPDFNEDPFKLGAFDNIANYTPGKGGGRAKFFVLGGEFHNDDLTVDRQPRLFPDDAALGRNPRISFSVKFSEEEGQPVMRELMLCSGEYQIAASKSPGAKGVDFACLAHGKPFRFSYPHMRPASLSFCMRMGGFLLQDPNGIAMATQVPLSTHERKVLAGIALSVHREPSPRPYATAPIRTKPERTYEPRRILLMAEGGHVPLVLARTLTATSEKKVAFLKALSGFGHACGLFEDVQVRRLGRKASDAFQIQVKISGPAFNLVDVGYGVSQALPLLVDSLLGEKRQVFLMQQPEVHLHPRAQAELATFVAHIIKVDKKTFVIETHSDHLVERVRMDVRDKRGVRPEDVTILYFQREGPEVRIYPIRIDAQGNILKAPLGYRQFFLEEERRFLKV